GDGDRPGQNLRVLGQVLDRGERGRRLAAAGFANQSDGLVLADREGDAADRLAVPAPDAEGEPEVGDLENVIAGRRPVVAHRSRACRIPSDARFTPTTRLAMAKAGKRTGHQ